MPTKQSSEIRVLVEMLDTAFDRRSWHGANLMGAIRGVDAKAAARRRVRGRKTIWEQLLHAAYWKHRVLAYVVKKNGREPAGFGRKGSNWPAMPEHLTEAAWREDRTMLIDLHKQLRREVALVPSKVIASDRKLRWMIQGAAAHDLYHAGQIKLLRRFK
jgi:hypothetical protein